METTAYDIATRFIGVREVDGPVANPHILAMLKLDGEWPKDDAVPWCSAFVNWVCWLLRLPRSKSLRARSWLVVGTPVVEDDRWEAGFDVVILKRGSGKQPGPSVINAPGHVGFFSALEGERIWILGGNQSDEVNVSSYPLSRVLGVRRLY